MLEDKELDNISLSITESQQTKVVQQNVETTPVINTEFSKKMDDVKQTVLEASQEDANFVETIKKNVKSAAVKLTEVEKEKAELQEQQVDYEKEKLGTKQQKNIHEQKENVWENRQKRRQYHYDGVKPIMKFVKIDEPMNLICLYFLTIILIIPFLIGKLINGTFGALIAGASDGNRTKAAKGFLWTITCVFAVLVLVCLVYLFLKSQGIDMLANIKN